MGYFNDQGAWVNKSGNLSLGGAGLDDGGADATHAYAKGDVFIAISPVSIVSDTQPALTRIGAGSWKRTLVASTTHVVLIPFDSAYLRTFAGPVVASGGGIAIGAAANPHGVKVRSVGLAYRTNGVDLTSITMTHKIVDLTAQASVPTTTDVAGAVAGNVVTQAANQRLMTFTPTTPAFVNTLDNLLVAEATIVTPMGSTCDILGAIWRVSVALY